MQEFSMDRPVVLSKYHRNVSSARIGMRAVFAESQITSGAPNEIETLPLIDNESGERINLYDRIVDAKYLASVLLAPKIKRHVINVIDDRTIEVNGVAVPLEGHDLYAFNSLLLADSPKTLPELAAWGLHSSTRHNELSKVLYGLSRRFNRLLSDDAVVHGAVDGENRFSLSPYVKVADARQMKDIIALEEDFGIEEGEAYEAHNSEMRLTERGRKIREVVTYFQKDPRVLRKINKYFLTVQPQGTAIDDDWMEKPTLKFPLLDGADEQALFRIINEGLAAVGSDKQFKDITTEDERKLVDLTTAHTIVYVSNLRLVGSVARSLTPRHVFSLDDMTQAGNLKMAEAIGVFEHERGYKFSVLARKMIRQGILNEQAKILNMPKKAYYQWLRINGARNHFYHQKGCEPSPEELESLTGIPAGRAVELEARRQNQPYSLEQLVADYDWDNLLETKDDTDSNTSRIVANEAADRIFASRSLNDRQKFILALRHGIVQYLTPDLEVYDSKKQRVDVNKVLSGMMTTDGLKLEEIGAILGLTRQRINQIEKAAIEKVINSKGQQRY